MAGTSSLQGAVYLVGADMVEALSFELLRKGLPIEFGCLEKGECAHHIGLCEGEGVFDAAVYMTFGSQMDDAVHLLVLHQLEDSLKIADVHLDKLVVGLVLDVLEIGEITGVCQG